MTASNDDLNGLEVSKRIREDPALFFNKFLGCQFWGKQNEIVQALKIHRKVAVRSCNSAGKTFSAARIALWFMSAYPPAVVISTAPTARQVVNQLWREMRAAHKGAKIPLGGRMMKQAYHIDEKWYALGFAVKAGEDGTEKFQGWHGDHILFIVDEASGVSPQVYEAITGGMASGFVRLLLIGNPNKANGDFHDAFKDPSYHKIHISAFDVPNVQEGEVIVPGLATYEWIEDMRNKYGEDSDVYRIRVLGEFPKNTTDTLIGIDSVESAFNEDRELIGDDEWLGVDVARYGHDKTAIVYRKGTFAKVLRIIDHMDTMEVAGACAMALKEYPKAMMNIDITGGLGAGPFDRLREQKQFADRVFGVNVASSPREDDFLNIRMEMWWAVKIWLKDATLEKHEDFYQLANPKYKVTSTGKMQLESKEEMSKRGVHSPDVGDALALTFARQTEGEFNTVEWV